MTTDGSDSHPSIARLAADHELGVDSARIRVVEAGLDYRVAFAFAEDGTEWVLRIPRRHDVADKIADEARTLDFVRDRLTVSVPDWRIRSQDLIAYPLLPGEPGLTLSDEGEPQWHFDAENPRYARDLGRLIAELHEISTEEARSAGIPARSPAQVREEWRSRLERVAGAFDVGSGLLDQWRAWIADDQMWPEYTAFTHGELYPAHVLLDPDGTVRSVLDWTTAEVGDPAVDFMYHHMLSTPETFRATVDAYREATGREPQRLEQRCAALVAAGPLTYAEYALTTGDPDHAATAAAQLNP